MGKREQHQLIEGKRVTRWPPLGRLREDPGGFGRDHEPSILEKQLNCAQGWQRFQPELGFGGRNLNHVSRSHRSRLDPQDVSISPNLAVGDQSSRGAAAEAGDRGQKDVEAFTVVIRRHHDPSRV
jgi:hypothetical protein